MLEQGKGAAAEKTLLRPQIVERGSVAAPKGN
jgi:hypothetical protein